MDQQLINVLAWLIVGFAFLVLLIFVARGLAKTYSIFKSAYHGKNQAGDLYVTERDMETRVQQYIDQKLKKA